MPSNVRPWDEKEVEYLKRFYNKKTIEALATKLKRTKQSVSGKLFRLGLKTKKEWTQDELDYLEDSLGRVGVKSIAKQLNRTTLAVYVQMRRMGLSVVDKYEVTVRRLCKVIGIQHGIIYKAINEGLIETDGRSKCWNKYHYIHPYNVRKYIIKNLKFHIFRCFECSNRVIGDIYCNMHTPEYEEKKYEIPQQFCIDIGWKDADRNKKIGAVLKEIRLSMGLSQKDFGDIIGYTGYWIGMIERGNSGRFDLEMLSHVFKSLGYRTELKIEKQL